jgi:hypothetical protein
LKWCKSGDYEQVGIHPTCKASLILYRCKKHCHSLTETPPPYPSHPEHYPHPHGYDYKYELEKCHKKCKPANKPCFKKCENKCKRPSPKPCNSCKPWNFKCKNHCSKEPTPSPCNKCGKKTCGCGYNKPNPLPCDRCGKRRCSCSQKQARDTKQGVKIKTTTTITRYPTYPWVTPVKRDVAPAETNAYATPTALVQERAVEAAAQSSDDIYQPWWPWPTAVLQAREVEAAAQSSDTVYQPWWPWPTKRAVEAAEVTEAAERVMACADCPRHDNKCHHTCNGPKPPPCHKCNKKPLCEQKCWHKHPDYPEVPVYPEHHHKEPVCCTRCETWDKE